MGLILDTVDPNTKAPISYWRITSRHYNDQFGTVEVTLAGYVNKEARETQASPVHNKMLRFNNEMSMKHAGCRTHELDLTGIYKMIKKVDAPAMPMMGSLSNPTTDPKAEPLPPEFAKATDA